LLTAGDQLVGPLHLTSARWQMLGAITLSPAPGTAPQLAAAMGMTRQGAQKQLNLLVEDGLVKAEPNPGHLRSPLYTLTRKGASAFDATERIQRAWATRLARGMSVSDLQSSKRLLGEFRTRLTAAEAPGANSARRMR